MFSYCGNNPVSRADDGGEFWHIAAGALIGAAVSFTSSVIGDVMSGEKIDWAGAGISAAFGAASGALAATGFGTVVQVAGGAALAGGENIIEQGREKGFDNIDYVEVAYETVVGGVSSRTNGLDKATKNYMYKYASNAKKQIVSDVKHNGVKVLGKSVASNGKYYFAHTSTLFYKPLMRDAKDSLNDAARKAFWEPFFEQ